MAKVSPVSAKYIIHAQLEAKGTVEKPDVIGAIFGQTEGLLGTDLELRELQRSGRIGRIEVNLKQDKGKTIGEIIIPSSLDKVETSLIAAALETIQRIGPCNAKIKVTEIEDVREKKREYVIERARELIKSIMEKSIPDSAELTEKVREYLRSMELVEYGPEKLPAGPGIDESDEIIIVEGRADVVNLLKHGIKNVIALNGSSVPKTIIELSKRKIATAFLDGDRGGDLILKELLERAEIDYVARAPNGKEVEDLTIKEMYKALRNKIPVDQIEMNHKKEEKKEEKQTKKIEKIEKLKITPEMEKKAKKLKEELIGTRAAYLLDSSFTILGKVPILELETAISEIKGVRAVVCDGELEKDVKEKIEKIGIVVF